MKRSKIINLEMMRKIEGRNTFRPLAIAITAAILSSCSDKQEVQVVASVEDCVAKTSLDQNQCQAAYQEAMTEAERTGPKYSTKERCEAEFGYGYCGRSQSSSGVFLPLMAGFMVGQMMGGRNDYGYRYNPVFRYNSPSSGLHNRYLTADGSVIGRSGRNSYSVPPSSLKTKPSVSKTVSRGGFGSLASAKSNWGGGRSRGWGG